MRFITVKTTEQFDFNFEEDDDYSSHETWLEGYFPIFRSNRKPFRNTDADDASEFVEAKFVDGKVAITFTFVPDEDAEESVSRDKTYEDLTASAEEIATQKILEQRLKDKGIYYKFTDGGYLFLIKEGENFNDLIEYDDELLWSEIVFAKTLELDGTTYFLEGHFKSGRIGAEDELAAYADTPAPQWLIDSATPIYPNDK